jgi:hypothetical protein
LWISRAIQYREDIVVWADQGQYYSKVAIVALLDTYAQQVRGSY